MTSSREIATLSGLAAIIRKHGSITKEDLIIESKISISYYDKLRPFIPLYFKDIEYDKPTKIWKSETRVTE